ncbi:excinuclease ATPase subunit [Chromobacterium alticapitis]|uniref:Excinuclease ATPase subunit n=1 Tax=Chromobacterium alticapitis TaxID=2073169 RepID=A0A2S5DDN8_9NEIS|nr:excinuclease ATPase subunit [Chromobacterium alticapitis]POZ61121.1 excinuclease ATPase subunit [Chromobacterium alticapitis]
MKTFAAPLLALALIAAPALARDTVVKVPLADVLAMPEAQGKLDGSVQFFLAGQHTPAIKKKMGSDVSNQKTNAFNKTDEQACRWTILSALISFQNSAKQRGANAVVNLVSYYKKQETRDSETIECHSGALIAGAALKGEYAKIGK